MFEKYKNYVQKGWPRLSLALSTRTKGGEGAGMCKERDWLEERGFIFRYTNESGGKAKRLFVISNGCCIF